MRADASTAECLVYTFREGLLSAVGHDLCLRVERFTVEVTGDPSAPAILGRFDAASLRVTGDVAPGDARKIEQHAADDVLAARRFPTIELRSTRVVRDGERARIEATLALHGTTRPLAFDAVADAGDWRAEVRLDQRDFGIKPFSAMLGTLRVRPDLVVRIRVPRA
ncbi:MAG TPA: YceI family protein [Polyangia bacterium]